VGSNGFSSMLGYFLPEILILLAIMGHIQKEIMSGLLDLKEEDNQEGIEDALIRYVRVSDLTLQVKYNEEKVQT
jgi:hypothetical protein